MENVDSNEDEARKLAQNGTEASGLLRGLMAESRLDPRWQEHK